MIILETTSEILEIETSTTSAIDVVTSYADITSTTFVAGSQEAAITTATTTTILSAPGASTQRQVKLISLENKGTAANTITLKKDVSGTEYVIYTATLQPSENLTYIDGKGFEKHSQSGDTTDMLVSDKRGPISATSFNMMKVGATTEAVGVMHFMGLVSGTPGAWSPGTPGVNGRATDGTTSNDAGCIPVKNAATGSNFLTSFVPTCTTASTQLLMDVLWVNSGLVVTTTTGQSITPVALPARDQIGTSDGNDVMAGILVTTATTNAGAVTNTTITYTNEAGTGSRTGTMASFPATAVAGTIVPFQLAAGDKGVRSVQTVTLGTSYGGGAISLVLFRIVAGAPVIVANAGGQFNGNQNINVRLYNGACLLPAYVPTATTASNVFAAINVEEK